MSTTETNTQSVKMAMEELWKVEGGKLVLCAKGFAFVDALLIDGYALNREAKLLDTPALASLELLSRSPLVAVITSCSCHSCSSSGASCGFGGGRPQRS